MYLDRAHSLRPMFLTWKWAKTCAKVIHILGLAHMWKGQTSGATKSRKPPEIHATDAGTRGDRRWPWRLSAYPSSASCSGGDRRGGVWATDVRRQRPSASSGAASWALRNRRWVESVGVMTDASVDLKTTPRPLWSASDDRRTLEHKSNRRVWRSKIDRWEFEARGHVARSCATNTGTASVAHAECPTALFEGVHLYICVGLLRARYLALWHTCEHLWARPTPSHFSPLISLHSIAILEWDWVIQVHWSLFCI
jgi:hypothetical protein